MVSILNSQSFGDCLHTTFALSAPAGESVPLVLVSVQEGSNSPRLENFSLLFRGPMAPCFPQAIYRLHHEKLGSMDLFLVPVGPDGQGMQYEAIFNRFRDPQ